MPADDTTGPGGRTALTGFLTNADDSLRVVHGDTPPLPPQPARFVERAAFRDQAGFDDEAPLDEEEWADQHEAHDAYALEAAEEPDEADDLDWEEWQEAERSSGLRGIAVAVLILVAGVSGVATIGWNLTHQKHDVLVAPQAATAPAPREVEVAVAAATPLRGATAPAAASPSESAAASAIARPARHTPTAERPRPEKLAKPKAAPRQAPSKATARTTSAAAPKLAKVTTQPVSARGKPGVDCANPQTVSRHMACDSALANANHQVGEAYLAAVVAGAPADQLKTEQAEWLNVRDDAAKRSPTALADAYKARIDALDRQRTQALNEPPH